MYDARIQRATALETAVSEYLQHLAVVAEHVGFEFRDPVCIGDKTQMFEQQSADAAAWNSSRIANATSARCGSEPRI